MGEATTRRGFLGAAVGAAGVGALAACDRGQPEAPGPGESPSQRPQVPPRGTFVVTLGTAGGPRPHARSGPSTAVVVDGVWHLVDCGAGTVTQLQCMGVNPADLGSVWFTHHHYDHNGDYSNLLMQGWHSGRVEPQRMFGPAGTRQFHTGVVTANQLDIQVRSRKAPDTWAEVTRMTPGKPVDLPGEGGGSVRCVPVTHPPIDTLAYRFDTPHGSVTVSGDTAPDNGLVDLARGSDVLVHEVLHEPSLGVILGTADTRAERERLRKHLLETHTTTDEVGKVAAQAQVGALVLTHLVPTDPEAVDARVWTRQPRRDFKGDVTLGEDLAVHPVGS